MLVYQRVEYSTNKLPGLVNIPKTMNNHHFYPFLMGRLTISSGPFSKENCNRLPEGLVYATNTNRTFALGLYDGVYNGHLSGERDD